MDTIDLIESFSEFKEFKSIDRVTMMSILEEVFRNMLRKKYSTDENIDVIINIDKGDLEIWRNREIVADGEVEEPDLQISYSEAIKIEPDFEVGEEVSEEIKLLDFGRRNIQALKQNLLSKIMELEKDNIYKKYKERVGEIMTGEVYQIWKKEILVLDDEGNELILPKSEQIPSDRFKKGDTLRAVVYKVDMKNNTPVVILSRTAPEFLERLFELEVPEVFDGLITIKRIVREPGERAKVAVESYDDRIDPVGACVGMKGSRIHGDVRSCPRAQEQRLHTGARQGARGLHRRRRSSRDRKRSRSRRATRYRRHHRAVRPPDCEGCNEGDVRYGRPTEVSPRPHRRRSV